MSGGQRRTSHSTAMNQFLEEQPSNSRPSKRLKIANESVVPDVNIGETNPKDAGAETVPLPKEIPGLIGATDGGDAQGEGKGEKNRNMSRRRDAAGYAKSRKGKEKDGKNAGRRGRRGTRNEEAQVGEGSTRATVEGGLGEAQKAPRLPKRQCALLIGFCGTGCSGMQMYVFQCSCVHFLMLNFA